jgi:hypothetical protein
LLFGPFRFSSQHRKLAAASFAELARSGLGKINIKVLFSSPRLLVCWLRTVIFHGSILAAVAIAIPLEALLFCLRGERRADVFGKWWW